MLLKCMSLWLQPFNIQQQLVAYLQGKKLYYDHKHSLTGKYDLSNSGFGVVAGIRQLTIKRSKLNINPAQGDIITTPDSGIGYDGVLVMKTRNCSKSFLSHSPAIDIVVPITVAGSGTALNQNFTTLEFETGIANNTLFWLNSSIFMEVHK